MRILHLADVHLDRPFVGMDRDAARRRRAELREALARCLAAAREQGADLVTIAGDLWEDEHVTPDTRAFVAHELGKLAPVPVLIACGNHDPLLAGGHWRRTAWPPNVRIFESGAPGEARAGPVSVWGVSWSGQGLDVSFLESFRAPADGRLHILLLHGTLRSVRAFLAGEGTEAYAPFDPADVERAGFALCLAGHLHAGFREGRVVYPGSPEPLGWPRSAAGRRRRVRYADSGIPAAVVASGSEPHCYALVDVTGTDPEVRLVPVNRRRYEDREVHCGGAASSAEIAERLARELGDPDPDALCVRVRLTGRVASDCAADAEALAAPHRGRFAALVVSDETTPEYDLEAIARQPSAAGFFVRAIGDRLRAAGDDETRELLRLAREAGLNAVHGRADVIRVD